MTLLKKENYFVCLVQCNVFIQFKVKKHIIFHMLYIIVAPIWPACTFLQSSLFWEARHALIGQLSSALWLAEYLKSMTEMLRPLPYCDAVSRHDNTKTIKPVINEAFVACCHARLLAPLWGIRGHSWVLCSCLCFWSWTPFPIMLCFH